MSQILTLHHVIEEVQEHNLSVVLTFVDFKKAFDSISIGTKCLTCCLPMDSIPNHQGHQRNVS